MQNETYLDIIDKYLIASKTDLNGIITDASKAMCEITGYSKEELIGKNHNIIRHPDMPASAFKDMWKTITSGKIWEGEVKNRKKDGTHYWVKTRISPTFDNSGKIIGYASIRVDITDKKRVEELSVTDELTQIYNRRFFNHIFPNEIARAIRESKRIGFAIFDVDNFKNYNDNYGHQKGDEVLKKIANVTSKTLLRAADYCFRLGGEEFGILIYDTDKSGFQLLVEKIRKEIEALNIKHKHNGKHPVVTASFGGTIFKCHKDTSIKTIYKLTDELLYFAKENGRNRIKLESFENIHESSTHNEKDIYDFIKEEIEFEKNQTKLFNNLISDSKDMIIIEQMIDDENSKVVYLNNAVKEALLYNLDEIEEVGLENIAEPLETSNIFKTHLNDLKDYQGSNDYFVFTSKDNRLIPTEISVKTITYNSLNYRVSLVRNISHRFEYINRLEDSVKEKTSQLEETLRKLKSYKEAMDNNSIVSVADRNGFIKYVNDKFCEVTGYSKEELIGQPHSIVRHPDTKDEVFKKMWETIKNKKIWKGELKNKKKNGDYYVVQSSIVPILDSNGEVEEYIATRYEITELYDKNREISKLANVDLLTGLENRISLNNKLDEVKKAFIAMIDLNGFHEINDFYGEKTGDKVIKRFAERLKEEIKEKYQLFHLNGDEFIILNTTKLNKETFKKDMRALMLKLNQESLSFDDKIFYLNTSISISYEEPKNLFSTVNLAHTFAKENNIRFNIYSYETSLEREYENNFKWVTKIKKAIEDDRIKVFFQPIVDTKTKEIVKYESLVRLIDTDEKVISPYFFLDIAKKSNHYRKITQVVIEQSIETAQKRNVEVSINITIEDIENKVLREYIYEKLENCTCCENITFELVESEGIENFDEINNVIKKLKSFGCKLAIDDFGTGYSNFEYLLKLNADIIKIDGSLIREIDTNMDRYLIVQTIVSFAKTKNLDVVAEFVSSEAIYEKILDLGIDYSQGYYFGEPKPF